MSDFTDVTAENLRLIRGSKGLTQEHVAEILGLEKHNVSKIENGKRSLTDPEKKLLDWYFFGKIPHRITAFPGDTKGILEFDETEWEIITMLAARDGFATPREWIAKKIRDYLAVFDLTKPAKANYAPLSALPSARVAEEPKTAN